MSKKHVPKISLKELSDKVFSLDNECKAIMYHLAKNGPDYLTNIAKGTSKFGKWEATRGKIKRRLAGSKRKFSLVETEYLIKVPQDKFRGGNQENMYYLTTKGMIAALSSGLHLDEIYLYKKYIHFLENILDDERLFNIVNDFLKNRIYLFLAWHAFNGIQLQKQIATQSYFRTFFRSTKLLTEYIPYDETCANEDFHVFLKNNFVSSGIIHCLLEISTDNILIHANVTEQRSDKIYNKLYRNRAFLEFWPMLIEEMQKIDYDSQILFDHLESIGGGNIVIDSGKESDKIKTELDKGINVKVSSDAVYQFLEYNSPNTIKNGDTSLQDLATHNL